MSSIDAYRRHLRDVVDWRSYLMRHASLPGGRVNSELAAAVAEEGDRVLFAALTSAASASPPDSPEEFLVVCGVVGLGRLIAEGDDILLSTLRTYANSRSARVQTAVVLALSRIGAHNREKLLEVADHWSCGTYLEMRAVADASVAADLYRDVHLAERAQTLLRRMSAAASSADGGDPDVKVLRRALEDAWNAANGSTLGRGASDKAGGAGSNGATDSLRSAAAT